MGREITCSFMQQIFEGHLLKDTEMVPEEANFNSTLSSDRAMSCVGFYFGCLCTCIKRVMDKCLENSVR